jgi:hypothetical protein
MTCAMVDAVFRHCRAEPDFGGGKYCVTTNEATSNCTTTVNCSMGVCRDGVCQ